MGSNTRPRDTRRNTPIWSLWETINFTAQNTAKPYSAETFDRCRTIGLRKHWLDFKKRCKLLSASCKSCWSKKTDIYTRHYTHSEDTDSYNQESITCGHSLSSSGLCTAGRMFIWKGFFYIVSSSPPLQDNRFTVKQHKENTKKHLKYSEHKRFSHSVHITAENRRSEITKCPTADNRLTETI
jgi:hypothetical protein